MAPFRSSFSKPPRFLIIYSLIFNIILHPTPITHITLHKTHTLLITPTIALIPAQTPNNLLSQTIHTQCPSYQMASYDPKYYIIKPTGPVENDYKFIAKLGSGQYGTVHSAVHRGTGKTWAVKTINKQRFRHDREYQFQAMRNEIAITRSIQHPNIITLHDVYEDENQVHLIMELCQGGELFDRIKSKTKYSEQEAQVVLRQIASALQCLHKNKIAHCDLKPDNFLFETHEDASHIKVIDFGMARALRRREYLQHLRGTPYYIAPEVLDGQYSEHCDMWSFGVVMFVMLFGYPPFHGNNDNEIFAAIRNGFDPRTKPGWGAWFPDQLPVSQGAKDLLERLLCKDPVARLTAEEVLEHPWTQGKDVPAHPLPLTVVSNLNNFIKKTQFTNEVLAHLTQSSMSSEEYIALARTFRFIDKNGDGTLTVEELREALMETENKSVNVQTLAKIVELADLDGDGNISWKELLLATTARRLAMKEDRLWASFKSMDTNGDGKLSVEELCQALGHDEAAVRHMIAEVDVDGNGVVDYEEFLSVFASFLQSSEENEINA